jgi:hypothetical protein
MHLNANLVHQCTLCGQIFGSAHYLKVHHRSHKPTNKEFIILASAFRNKCVIYRKTYEETMQTLEQSFSQDVSEMTSILTYEIGVKKSLKASIIFHAEFMKPLDAAGNENLDTYVICLRTTTNHLCNADEISIFLQDSRQRAQQRIDDFVEGGSGWILSEIIATDIEIGGCTPLNGGCQMTSIKSLKNLKRIPLTDSLQQCFFHAIAYHYTKSANQKKLDKFIEKYFTITITSPVKVSDIKKFERDNPNLNLKINVMYAEGDNIYPIYVSGNEDAKNQINLLLYNTAINGVVITHYSYIENLSTLLRRTYTSDINGKKGYEKTAACPNCLCKFTSELALGKHLSSCMKNKPQATVLPEKGDTLKFMQYNKKYPVPYIGFIDFEAKQVTPKHKCETCNLKNVANCLHKTKIKTLQEPMTYSLIILDTIDDQNKVIVQKTYSGDDCVKHLMNELLSVETKLLANLSEIKEMPNMSEGERKELLSSTNICHICEKALNSDRVIDHDHLTSKIYGLSHNSCNLNRKVPKNIPIFAHNLENYDSHFILQKLNRDPRIHRIKGLPHNTEKFKTITINSFVFLDSLAFLSAPLSELANNLAANPSHQFNILDQMNLYTEETKSALKPLLLRKGVYPYEFAENIKVLKNAKKLPSIGNFYSSLTNTSISAEEYKHGENVFSSFKCEDMMHYTELYCRTDTALLAEVMVQFRKEIRENFGLDPW